jgi:hypothetical protein
LDDYLEDSGSSENNPDVTEPSIDENGERANTGDSK